jgi:hypothetical protein
MCGLYFLLIVAAAFAARPASCDPVAQMSVDAKAAIVEIDPLPDGRRLIRLPALEFTLTIETQCATEMRAESVSISAADTSKTYSISDSEGQSIVEASLTIPRRQVPPLAIETFCQSRENESSRTPDLHVQDAFTAHISLRCTGKQKQMIVYTSQPLDVLLRCSGAEGGLESSEDQESSSISTAR